MKTEIFVQAIKGRYKIHLLYEYKEITFDPYLISVNKSGRKIIYGRINNSNAVCSLEYNKILNIRPMEKSRFSPIIPLLPN